jgi:iron complex transport system substrate-binding protein
MRAFGGFGSVAATAIACMLLAAPRAGADEIVDDAQRRVEMPEGVDRVFAAGAPAEILLYTLVPEMLGGLNHQPSDDARAFMPPEHRSLPPIATLPDRDDPKFDRDLLALQPDVYVDYGTIDDDYIGALEDISKRTNVPAVIFDGRFANIPAVYRKLGAALGVEARGEKLAAEAARLLDKYRNSLAGSQARVYLACSQNGTMPCVQGHAFGEAAAWLGAVNVAGTTESAPRRALTIDEIRAAAPTVIVAASAASAAQLRADPQWQTIPAVADGRVFAPPTLPFNWGPRPPSVNRLLGMLWMAYAIADRDFDAAFFADARAFFAAFYHVTPTDEQLRGLVAAK